MSGKGRRARLAQRRRPSAGAATELATAPTRPPAPCAPAPRRPSPSSSRDVTNPFFGGVMRGAQRRRGRPASPSRSSTRPTTRPGSSAPYEALRGQPSTGYLVFGIDAAPAAARRARRADRPDGGRVARVPGGPAGQRRRHRRGHGAPLGLGHRRIGRIAAPFARRAFGDREERWRAALDGGGPRPGRDAAAAARSTSTPRPRPPCRSSTPPDPPTAIFCDDDILAGGVYLAVRELDRRIPGDVSVVGFDDLAFTRLLDPPLTTVTADAAGLGARALRDPARPHGGRARRAGADAPGHADGPRLDRAAGVSRPG